MPKPAISVIVCAYADERWGDLLAAAESLRRQSLPPAEVIVVVDHNAPLFERARAHLADMIVVANGQARGLSGARNTGLALARGEIVAFMDEDAVANPRWLEALAAGYTSEHILGVGGTIMPCWEAGRPGWFPEEFDWVVGCTYRGMPTATAPVRNLIGCNMSFRRAALVELGGFRHGIGRVGRHPLGCEETELCIRLGQRWPRAELRHEPWAIVAHRVPAARGSWAYFRARCYAEGRSKATVSRLVGRGSALATERSYVKHTLPKAVARELRRGGATGAARALALAAGLLFTATGYLMGAASPARGALEQPGPLSAAGVRR